MIPPPPSPSQPPPSQQPPQPPPSPPSRLGRILRSLLAATILAAVAIPLVRLHKPSPLETSDPAIVSEALPRLRFLRDSLDRGSAVEMQQLFPEGYLFSYLLYGLSWVQVGVRDPGLKARAVAEARWALSHVDSEAGRAVFDKTLDPPYGVFYLGWSAWLRGVIVWLSGEPDARFDTDVRVLAEAFSRNLPGEPFLKSYPGQAWPCDSVVGLAAIRLGDTLNRTDNGPLIGRWLAAANARRDTATGLLPHTADAGSGPRATSQVIILRFLPEIDPEGAVRDWTRFKELFGSDILGIPGIREYPRGSDDDGDGEGDVDSGPLPLGMSLSASAVALGAAVIHRDRRAAAALTGLAEATGVPVQWAGRKRYAAGLMPVGDAFLLWSYTAISPSAPQFHAENAAWPSRFWRVPWYAAAYLVVMAGALAIFRRRLSASNQAVASSFASSRARARRPPVATA